MHSDECFTRVPEVLELCSSPVERVYSPKVFVYHYFILEKKFSEDYFEYSFVFPFNISKAY